MQPQIVLDRWADHQPVSLARFNHLPLFGLAMCLVRAQFDFTSSPLGWA